MKVFPAIKFSFQSICDQGAVRPNNEDAIKFGLADDGNLAWMVIADGMGGHLAGEVASGLLVDEIETAFNNLDDFNSQDWLCWIEIELNRANNKIFAQAQKNIEQKGMGTTAVLAIIHQQQCYLGWVGDSRCYRYRIDKIKPDNLIQLTIDHTMIQALLDKGAISQKEAEASNNKNMLSRAIGVKKGIDVDTRQVTIYEHDILLLSTDGLHDSLSLESFESSIKKISKGQEIGNELVKKAVTQGSKDNITFGSIRVNPG